MVSKKQKIKFGFLYQRSIFVGKNRGSKKEEDKRLESVQIKNKRNIGLENFEIRHY